MYYKPRAVLEDGLNKSCCFSENKEVNAKATELYDKWKSMVERRVELSLNKPTVQYDEETNRKREKSMQFLREAGATHRIEEGRNNIRFRWWSKDNLATYLKQLW